MEALSGEVSSYSGAVAGLAVVLFILLIIALGVIYYLWKKLKTNNQVNELAETHNGNSINLGTQVLGDITQENMTQENIKSNLNDTADNEQAD